MGDLRVERDHRRGAYDALERDHVVDDPLQVGVGARDDPGQDVARSGRRVRLEDLGDRREMLGDLVVRGAGRPVLADLQRDERRDRVADRGGVELWGPSP